MSYTPPLGNALDLQLRGYYTPPQGGSIELSQQVLVVGVVDASIPILAEATGKHGVVAAGAGAVVFESSSVFELPPTCIVSARIDLSVQSSGFVAVFGPGVGVLTILPSGAGKTAIVGQASQNILSAAGYGGVRTIGIGQGDVLIVGEATDFVASGSAAAKLVISGSASGKAEATGYAGGTVTIYAEASGSALPSGRASKTFNITAQGAAAVGVTAACNQAIPFFAISEVARGNVVTGSGVLRFSGDGKAWYPPAGQGVAQDIIVGFGEGAYVTSYSGFVDSEMVIRGVGVARVPVTEAPADTLFVLTTRNQMQVFNAL